MTVREDGSLLNVRIGAVVRAWREERGWSTRELATRIGKSSGYISLLETDQIHQPKDDQLTRLAAALDIPVSHLLLRRMPDAALPDEQTPLPKPAGAAPSSQARPGRRSQREQLLEAIQAINERLDQQSLRLDQLSRENEEIRSRLDTVIANQIRAPQAGVFQPSASQPSPFGAKNRIDIINQPLEPPESPYPAREDRPRKSGRTETRPPQSDTPDHPKD